MTADQLKAASNDIVSAAQGRAVNRSTFDRVKSSIGTRGHQSFKPTYLTNAATTVATQAIPVPVVGTIVGMVVDKATAAAKTRYDAGKSAAAEKEGGYKKIKRDIKDLDIDSIDRYRHKIADQVKAFNEAAKATQAPACEGAFVVAYRFSRVKYRVGILRDAASKMQAIASSVLAWCDKIDGQATADVLDKAVQSQLQRHNGEVNCGNHCVVNGGKNASTEFNRVSTKLKATSR